MAEKAEPLALTEAEIAGWKTLKFGGFEEAAKKFFSVNHRDRVGEVVPYALTYVQRKYEAVLRKALALNLLMQYEAAKQGQQSYILDVVRRVESGEAINEWEIGFKGLHLKYRRTGASCFWGHKGLRRICAIDAYSCIIMSHDGESAQSLFDMPKLSFDNWPTEYARLRPEIAKDNEIRFRLNNGSQYRIMTAGAKDKRERLRGEKVDFAHLSEYAYYKSYRDVAQLMKVLRPHAWLIKESTAAGKGNPFFREWQNALTVEEVEAAYKNHDAETLSRWNRHYKIFSGWLDDDALVAPVMDWERQSILENLSPDETAILELVKDQNIALQKIKFRREAIGQHVDEADVIDPEIQFKREFPKDPDEAFESANNSVFRSDLLDKSRVHSQAFHMGAGPPLVGLLSHTAAPIRTTKGSANFIVFRPPQRGHVYVIGGDVSAGRGKDYSVAVVYDRHDGTRMSEVACFSSNRIEPSSFGHILTLLGEWYNQAFICCEMNSHALSVHKVLVEDNRYPMVYRRKTLDAVGAEVPDVWQFGFQTNNQTKGLLIGDMQAIFHTGGLSVMSPKGIEEMSIYEFDAEKNRYSAPDGEHDDYVIATGCAVHGHLRAGTNVAARKARMKQLAAMEPGSTLLPEQDGEDDPAWKIALAQLDRAAKANQRARGPGYLPPLAKPKGSP